MVKYPNQKKINFNTKIAISKSNNKKARLGSDFEKIINNSNEFYIKNEIASIYKKPTPIQVVEVSYPMRSKAKITEAYYKTPSTTDYNGIYKGHYIDFEAKSCHTSSFPFSHIYVHQIEHLKLVHKLGGIAFLLIEFPHKREIYLLPITKLLECYNHSLNGGRKSIPYQYFTLHGYLIKRGYQPEIDYLKVIDQYLKK